MDEDYIQQKRTAKKQYKYSVEEEITIPNRANIAFILDQMKEEERALFEETSN